jgi:hypothetical protein
MESINEFTNTLLAVAFTAWAGVVGYIGGGIRNDLKKVSADLNKYIITTETRLAIIETHLGINPRGNSKD